MKEMKQKLDGQFQDPKLCYDCFCKLPAEARNLPTGQKLAALAALPSSGTIREGLRDIRYRYRRGMGRSGGPPDEW